LADKARIGLMIAQSYCSPAFYSLFNDYSIKYEGKGLPRKMINKYFDYVMKESEDEDNYKQLLINLFIGNSAYFDGPLSD
jgi:hypothetical protein